MIDHFFSRRRRPACKQIDFGVQAIFGPTDAVLGPHVQSICAALDLPHLEIRLDTEPRGDALDRGGHDHDGGSGGSGGGGGGSGGRAGGGSAGRGPPKDLSINLHPSQDVLNMAYRDLMRFLNWTKVAIVYEQEEGAS